MNKHAYISGMSRCQESWQDKPAFGTDSGSFRMRKVVTWHHPSNPFADQLVNQFHFRRLSWRDSWPQVTSTIRRQVCLCLLHSMFDLSFVRFCGALQLGK